MKPIATDESARTKLIELAARLTDLELGGANQTARYLRAFRKNYRHLAVSVGEPLGNPNLAFADRVTEAALDPKSEDQAA